MLSDLPLLRWLWVLAIPLAFICLAVVAWLWAIRWNERREEKRQARIAQFLAPRGWRLSAADPDRERVEAALVELRGGGSFDIHWMAAGNDGTLFEYRTGAALEKHGYGYLERSPFPNLTRSVRIFPRTRWMSVDRSPTFIGGREVGEGWANPEFHKRYGVVAQDAGEGSRVVAPGLQFLLLGLPDVSGTALDNELVEVAVDRSHWTVLGRKWDWGATKIGDGFPDLENHLRLAARIRDALEQ